MFWCFFLVFSDFVWEGGRVGLGCDLEEVIGYGLGCGCF